VGNHGTLYAHDKDNKAQFSFILYVFTQYYRKQSTYQVLV